MELKAEVKVYINTEKLPVNASSDVLQQQLMQAIEEAVVDRFGELAMAVFIGTETGRTMQ